MLTEWLITLGTFFCSLLYLRHRQKLKHLKEKLEVFPGPSGYPLIGNALLAWGSSTDTLKKMETYVKDYDSPSRLWILDKPAVLIYDPVNFETVSNKALDKPYLYKFAKDLIENGLVTTNGLHYKKKRRALEPTFNTTIMSQYYLSTVNESAEKLTQELAEFDEGHEFDLFPLLLKCAGKTIFKSAMDYHSDDTGDEIEHHNIVEEFSHLMEKAMAIFNKRAVSPWLYPNVLNDIYNKVAGNNLIFKRIRNIAFKILEAKRRKLKCIAEGRNNKSFIETLVTSELLENLDDKELVDEIITFMAAGTESVAISLSFTLLYLAMNPHIQEQAHEELFSIFGDSNRPPTLNDIDRLSLLDRCIKETLRLFSGPFVFRQANEDIELRDGRILPAGSHAVLSMYMMHRNPKVYDNPQEWNPDRFLPSQVNKRHAASFAAFSTGYRSCPGMKFAMLEMKILASSILRSYKLITDMKMEKIKCYYDVGLRKKNGYKVRLHRKCM